MSLVILTLELLLGCNVIEPTFYSVRKIFSMASFSVILSLVFFNSSTNLLLWKISRIFSWLHGSINTNCLLKLDLSIICSKHNFLSFIYCYSMEKKFKICYLNILTYLKQRFLLSTFLYLFFLIIFFSSSIVVAKNFSNISTTTSFKRGATKLVNCWLVSFHLSSTWILTPFIGTLNKTLNSNSFNFTHTI